jgi:L-threonylcarbamoyladenylate synthase
MKYRHYAPDAKVVIVRGDSGRAAQYILEQAHASGLRASVLCFDEEIGLFGTLPCVSYGPEKDYPSLARNLFDALRKLDNGEADIIYARCPESGDLTLAVENRLNRAAGFQVVNV